LDQKVSWELVTDTNSPSQYVQHDPTSNLMNRMSQDLDINHFQGCFKSRSKGDLLGNKTSH